MASQGLDQKVQGDSDPKGDESAPGNPVSPHREVPAIKESSPLSRVFATGRQRTEHLLRAATRHVFDPLVGSIQSIGLKIPDRTTRIHDLSPEKYHELIRKDVPTIGLTLTARHREASIIALAAQYMRSKDERVPNVVFIPPTSLGACFVRENNNGTSTLTINRGVLVDSSGRCYEGAFPEHLPIELVGTFNGRSNFLLQTAEELGIPFINGSHAFRICRSKNESTALAKSLDIRSPESLRVEIPEPGVSAELELAEKLEKFLESVTHSEVIVVKPDVGSGGSGVRFVKRDPSSLVTTLLSLREKSGVKVAELQERIPPFSIKTHITGGTDCDWNIRVLTTQKGVVDTEVRIQTVGHGAVNKQRGAEIIETARVFNAMRPKRDAGGRLEQFNTQIADLAPRIARELKGNFIGLDFILDSELRLWLIEPNAGAVGGLKSLAEIRNGVDGKLKAACVLIRHWMDSFDLPLSRRFTPKDASGWVEIPLFDSVWCHPSLSREYARLTRQVQAGKAT